MYKKLKIALVIPAYNEQRLIKPTLEHVPKTIDRIYVIDDCSTDNMPAVIHACMKKDKRIHPIRHKKNAGVGQAIITGYKQAIKDGHDIAIVVGGDYQMDLEDLPNFLKPISEGKADYIKGNRFMMTGFTKGNAFKDMPFKRFFGNSTLSFMTKMASGYWHIFDTQDGYTAITKEAINKVDWNQAWKGYGYVSDWLVLFNVTGLRVMDVPRKAIYRKGERQSQIKIGRYIMKMFPRLVRLFFWRLKMKYFYFDFHPLILFYLMGLTLFPIGILLGIGILIKTILGTTFSINWAILCALLIITGIQSLFFAMLFDTEQNRMR